MKALRYIFIILLVLGVATAIIWRLVYLQVVTQPFLKRQGDVRSIRTVTIPAKRGVITDRNGVPLAVSVPADTVWVDPKDLDVKHKQWQQLLTLLGLDPDQLAERLAKKSGSRFMYLKRQIPPPLAAKIKALRIPGVHIQREYKRFYPEGEVFANVVGFTNIDNQGQEGIELGYNKQLAGENGKKTIVKDLFGNVIDTLSYTAAKSGQDIQLTLDKNIQYLTYQALKAQVIRSKAEGGSAVLLDARTGEILAMANYPSFNPNDRSNVPKDAMRNRAVTDAFEPGSVMKPFAMVTALNAGVVKPDDVVNTAPGSVQIQGHLVRDFFSHGEIPMWMVIKKSSNVGISKVLLRLPDPSIFPLKLREFGFGSLSGIGYPGEQYGTVADLSARQKFSLATMAFGYGIATTTLQLADAYAVLANQGRRLKPSLVRQHEQRALADLAQGEEVVSPQAAKQIVSMMKTVLESGGTAMNVRIRGYTAAAKTGTARKAVKGGYASRYVAVFAGIIPADDPRYVMAVIVNDPRSEIYYGGSVAGPVFSRVMRQIMPQTLPPTLKK